MVDLDLVDVVLRRMENLAIEIGRMQRELGDARESLRQVALLNKDHKQIAEELTCLLEAAQNDPTDRIAQLKAIRALTGMDLSEAVAVLKDAWKRVGRDWETGKRLTKRLHIKAAPEVVKEKHWSEVDDE